MSGTLTLTPFEWWDVVDAQGATRSQLCTTRAVAQAIQFGSAWELLAPEFPLDSYAAAHAAATAAWPRSTLAAFYPPSAAEAR